jgi:hypothetical protein
MPQAEYAKFERNIYERWGEVIRDVGVKIDQGIQSPRQSACSISCARACRRIPSAVHRQNNFAGIRDLTVSTALGTVVLQAFDVARDQVDFEVDPAAGYEILQVGHREGVRYQVDFELGTGDAVDREAYAIHGD